jgi:hypothetical protein
MVWRTRRLLECMPEVLSLPCGYPPPLMVQSTLYHWYVTRSSYPLNCRIVHYIASLLAFLWGAKSKCILPYWEQNSGFFQNCSLHCFFENCLGWHLCGQPNLTVENRILQGKNQAGIGVLLMSLSWLQSVYNFGVPPCCDHAAPKAHGVHWPWLHWVVHLPLLALQGILFFNGNHITVEFSRFEVGFVPLLWSVACLSHASQIVLHNGCIILYLVLVQQLDWIIPGLWPQSSRKELVADIQELKRKVTGAVKEEGLWGTWATGKDPSVFV